MATRTGRGQITFIDVSDGDPGTAATQTAEGIVYYTIAQSGTPSTPSASNFNFSTGAFTSLPSNWQSNPVEVEITNSSNVFWQSRWRAVQAPGASSATVTFVNPTGSLTLGTDIQSDNFVAGTSGWRIQRDTGNAEFGAATIRGTLTANQIQLGSGLIIGSDETVQVNPAFIRDVERSGRNFGNINITTASVSENDVGENILVDSIVFNSNNVNRTLVLTTQMSTTSSSPQYGVYIYGDIDISTGGSSSRAHSVILTASRGNITMYGNLIIEGNSTITFNATNGCVNFYGTVTDKNGVVHNINNDVSDLEAVTGVTVNESAGNICSANPVP